MNEKDSFEDKSEVGSITVKRGLSQMLNKIGTCFLSMKIHKSN